MRSTLSWDLRKKIFLFTFVWLTTKSAKFNIYFFFFVKHSCPLAVVLLSYLCTIFPLLLFLYQPILPLFFLLLKSWSNQFCIEIQNTTPIIIFIQQKKENFFCLFLDFVSSFPNNFFIATFHGVFLVYFYTIFEG